MVGTILTKRLYIFYDPLMISGRNKKREQVESDVEEDLNLSTLITEIRLLRQDIQKLTLRIDKCDRQFEQQDREIKDLKIEITELRHKMEVQEQLNVKRELEIVGVPEQLNENLTHVVMIASKKIGVDLQMTDLDEVRRVGTKNPKNTTNRTVSRPIVVKFLSKIKRDDVLSAYKGRRKLTSEDLVPGSSSSVYINERLTAQNRQLFREARTRAKMQNFQYCWTRNGTVFIRKAANTNGFKHPAIPIRSQKDIEDHLGQVCTPAECVLQEDFPRESVPATLPN
ncbi:hypothetical protein ACJJTC_007762 [Scirpophaga incertulas]